MSFSITFPSRWAYSTKQWLRHTPSVHGSQQGALDHLPALGASPAGDVLWHLQSSARGIWALKVSLVILSLTALFQLAIVSLSGSVGPPADSIHNVTDALTAMPRYPMVWARGGTCWRV